MTAVLCRVQPWHSGVRKRLVRCPGKRTQARPGFSQPRVALQASRADLELRYGPSWTVTLKAVFYGENRDISSASCEYNHRYSPTLQLPAQTVIGTGESQCLTRHNGRVPPGDTRFTQNSTNPSIRRGWPSAMIIPRRALSWYLLVCHRIIDRAPTSSAVSTSYGRI